MTISTLQIGGKHFVVVPQREFERMRKENARMQELLREDATLGRLAAKELRAFRRSGSRGIPWEQVKRELGL